jgi:hypothetical protein
MHGFLDAVAYVLEQLGEPADCRQLADLMQEKKAWRSDLQATENIVRFRLRADLKRFGNQSQFMEFSAEMYGLRKWARQARWPESRAA